METEQESEELLKDLCDGDEEGMAEDVLMRNVHENLILL